jgi:hypothetical protein
MIPSRLTKPYLPLREWIAWRIAELISPRSFFGRTATNTPGALPGVPAATRAHTGAPPQGER